jgi:hypothetical protein
MSQLTGDARGGLAIGHTPLGGSSESGVVKRQEVIELGMCIDHGGMINHIPG